MAQQVDWLNHYMWRQFHEACSYGFILKSEVRLPHLSEARDKMRLKWHPGCDSDNGRCSREHCLCVCTCESSFINHGRRGAGGLPSTIMLSWHSPGNDGKRRAQGPCCASVTSFFSRTVTRLRHTSSVGCLFTAQIESPNWPRSPLCEDAPLLFRDARIRRRTSHRLG